MTAKKLSPEEYLVATTSEIAGALEWRHRWDNRKPEEEAALRAEWDSLNNRGQMLIAQPVDDEAAPESRPPEVSMTAKLKALTREDILEAKDRLTEWVDVPEWGGRVLVRSLEGLERDRYEGSFVHYGRDAKGAISIDGYSNENVRARLCALAVIDEDGRNLFSEADVLVLGHKNAAALDRVFNVARRLSGLTDEDVEALTKQLGEAPGSDGPSNSPESSE